MPSMDGRGNAAVGWIVFSKRGEVYTFPYLIFPKGA